MSNAAKQIDALLDKACEIALAEIERLARNVMRRNPRCKSFCMGMGAATFYDSYGVPIGGWADKDCSPKYLKPFDDFVNEFDRYLHITGSPMKIVGPDGPLLKDW